MQIPRKLICGNWKMHKTRAESKAFGQSLAQLCQTSKNKIHAELMIAMPFTLIESSFEWCSRLSIKIAAQNMYYKEYGAFTGEVSALMLKDLGVTHSLVGHSERRSYFGETNEIAGLKAKACLDAYINPIACVGESLKERETNQTFEVLSSQLSPILNAALASPRNLIIAYEPVWAIGTGRTATPGQAQEVHAFIRDVLSQKFGKTESTQIRILYGGSVNPANASDLLSQKDIDGALVGGASLKADDFYAIGAAAPAR